MVSRSIHWASVSGDVVNKSLLMSINTAKKLTGRPMAQRTTLILEGSFSEVGIRSQFKGLPEWSRPFSMKSTGQEA